MIRSGLRPGPAGRAWRAALAVFASAVLLSLPSFAAAGAGAIAPADLDPLLRALSVRPWWGDPPPLGLVGLDGRRQALSDLKGHVALLYFWATWCPICTGELPSQIEALHREFEGQGLVIWAVSVRESPERVTAWLKQHPLSVRVLLDIDGEAATTYRATGTPTFVLIDRSGQLAGRGVGPRDWSGDRGHALIRALLRAS